MRNSSGNYIFFCSYCSPPFAIKGKHWLWQASEDVHTSGRVDQLTSNQVTSPSRFHRAESWCICLQQRSDCDLLFAKIGYSQLITKFLGQFYCNYFATHIVLFSFIVIIFITIIVLQSIFFHHSIVYFLSSKRCQKAEFILLIFMLRNMTQKAHFLGFSLRIWWFVQNYASKSSSFVPFCVVCLKRNLSYFCGDFSYFYISCPHPFSRNRANLSMY